MQRDALNFMIGPVFTGTAAAAMRLLTNGKLPQFIVGSARSVFGPQFPYAFRLNCPSSCQGAVLIGYATGILKKSKVGPLVVKDALGARDVEAATAELAKRDRTPSSKARDKSATTTASWGRSTSRRATGAGRSRTSRS